MSVGQHVGVEDVCVGPTQSSQDQAHFAPPDQRQKRVKEAEADLLEAEHIVSWSELCILRRRYVALNIAHLPSPSATPLLQLQRLDIEARSLPPVTSRALLQKLKDYKADIAKLRSDAKTAGTSSVESRWVAGA